MEIVRGGGLDAVIHSAIGRGIQIAGQDLVFGIGTLQLDG